MTVGNVIELLTLLVGAFLRLILPALDERKLSAEDEILLLPLQS